MSVNVGHPPAPEVLGLPTTGAMGKEPAVTVSRLMALASLAVAIAANRFGYELPPDVRAFGDTWGLPLAGASIAAWQLLQGRLIRNRVVSPATALNLIRKATLPTVDFTNRPRGTGRDPMAVPPPGPFN